MRDRLERTGELRDATALYASLMLRAQQTADIVAPAVGDGSVVVRHDCGFCEQHAGEADGILWSEYMERYGVEPPWADRSRRAAPGSDSIDDQVARVVAALERVATEHAGTTVAIVCHGGVVWSALEAFTSLEYGERARNVENTSLTEFERDENGRWWLVRFNDAAHLSAL